MRRSAHCRSPGPIPSTPACQNAARRPWCHRADTWVFGRAARRPRHAKEEALNVHPALQCPGGRGTKDQYGSWIQPYGSTSKGQRWEQRVCGLEERVQLGDASLLVPTVVGVDSTRTDPRTAATLNG